LRRGPIRSGLSSAIGRTRDCAEGQHSVLNRGSSFAHLSQTLIRADLIAFVILQDHHFSGRSQEIDQDRRQTDLAAPKN